MKLNCDLGETFSKPEYAEKYGVLNTRMKSNDADIMPFIDMANIACGFHAGDALMMATTVALAKKHHVAVGAHPSYQDLAGFGRRSMVYQPAELMAIIHYQIGALAAITKSQNMSLSYVKPHGALYNDMMKDLAIFDTVCQAISGYDQTLRLLIQAFPNVQPYEKIAAQYGIHLLFEAFADRNYQANGLLVPRSEKNAVIKDVNAIVARCQHLLTNKQILSENDTPLTMQVDTLCVHGDHPKALEIVTALRQLLQQTSE